MGLALALAACSRPTKTGATDARHPPAKATETTVATAVEAGPVADDEGSPTIAPLVSDAGTAFVMPPTRGPFEWRQVLGKHWQISSPPGEEPAVTDLRENTTGKCRAGMVEIAGSMKVASGMDERQQAVCSKWISRKFPERCAVFDRKKWLTASQGFKRKEMHYCIDRFEYPNRRGEFPVILVNWVEAKGICEADKKRLCTEPEWSFACEGEEATPYPYGYVRDGDACIVDHPWIPFNPYALGERSTDKTKKELARLWQGEASGSRPHCKSVFGVYDMIGNIDEWTQATTPGRPSVLKGGYWGPVRTRCRPTTRAHGELHVFYQQGFRCCEDVH